MQELGEALHNTRQKKHYSLRKAAEEMGISPSTLCRIEKGEVPDYSTIAKVLMWLREPEAYTIGGMVVVSLLHITSDA